MCRANAHVSSSCVQVQPKHVKEAFRLLNKSIIRVETPDVNLEQEDELEEQQDGGTLTTYIRVHVCLHANCAG